MLAAAAWKPATLKIHHNQVIKEIKVAMYVTAKGDFLDQRDLWPFIKHSISTENLAESRFKLQNKTQD